MNHDINVGKVRLNCFRQSKEPGVFMLQMREPGGTVDAKYLSYVEHISGPGVTATSISEHVRPLTFQELNMKIFRQSMPIWNSISKRWTELSATPIWIRWPMSRSRGTPRRVIRPSGPEISPPVSEITTVSAAIPIRLNWQGRSNRSSSQVITISRSIYPACPNDCNKAHMCDFGIIGTARMTYRPERCIGCGACVKACEQRATRVLSKNEETQKIEKDACCCVGCGECCEGLSGQAWTRQQAKFYRVILGGRTGRQTPRAGKMFLNWAAEEVILGVLGNWQKFSAWVMDYKPEYLHGGRMIDRAGYKKFKEIMLEGVKLNPECLVAEDIFWSETEYRSNFNVKPDFMHHTAGPQAE